MRILVLGAGGVGGYFGARLAAGGCDVTFLVRSGRAAKLKANGLTVQSPLGGISLPDVRFITQAEAPVDLIILSCKAYDLGSAMDTIAPAVGPGTLILPLLNGLRHLDDLDARFGKDKVLGGACHIGVTMTETGEILHLNKLHRFLFGARSPNQAVEAVYQALLLGGFDLTLSPDITLAMWEKFAFLSAYAGITCLMRATIGANASTDNGAAIALALFEECLATARASGFTPGEDYLESSRGMLIDPSSSGTASMLRDMLAGGRTEHEHIFGDMLHRAQSLGVAAPVLTIAHAHMQAYAVMNHQTGGI